METSDFELALPKIIERLCEQINQVYHLEQKQALATLAHTHFFRSLSNASTGLWKLDTNKLFLLYQDEIEYGKLV